jgi:Fe-S cluster assembly protein SufD
MSVPIPVRLGPAELTLIEQLQAANATSEVEALSTVGLPTRKVEAYHYTDLKTLWREVPPLADGVEGGASPTLEIAGATRFTLLNGRVQDALVQAMTAPLGVHAATADAPLISAREDVLARLNIALAPEALNLHVGAGGPYLLHIDRRTEGAASHAPSAAGISVADGVEATIVETYGTSGAAHVANHSTFLTIGRNAVVTHVVVDLSAAEARTFAIHEYAVGEGSVLRTLVINAGSALNRTLIQALMTAQGAKAALTGLNLADEGQHHDVTLQVNHRAERTECKPLYKQNARGRSKAVFQGRIVVERGAQKTDAKMNMQGLMLSEDAEILSKPELEIYADDVVCGHGSTCGRLDEDALFYLMSRGVRKAEAETMLIRAFLEELIAPVQPEVVREVLTGVVERWLSAGGS